MEERHYCSFCRQPAEALTKGVAGPGVFICAACVGHCQYVLAEGAVACFSGLEVLSEAQLLATLKPVASASERARDALHHQVEELRARRVSWEKIAKALGCSRQAAWERFG